MRSHARHSVWLALPALALLLAACAIRERKSVFIDPALIALLPSDADTLAGLRIQELGKTPYLEAVRDAGLLAGLEDFYTLSGLHREQEVWELLIATGEAETVLLARGKFSVFGGMEPRLAKPALRRFQYKGYSLQGDEQNAVVFLNSSTAAVGSLKRLKSVLDARNLGADPGPASLLQMAATVPPDAQLWLVSRKRDPVPGGGERTRPWAAGLPDSGSLVAWATFAEMAVGEARAVLPDESLARDWEARVRSRFRTNDPPAASGIPDAAGTIRIQRQATEVRIEAKATPDRFLSMIRNTPTAKAVR